jgi:adenosine deaminase
LDGSFDADFLWKYLKEHPESVYCLPVRVNPPWDPTKTLHIRDHVMNCQTSQDYFKLCTCRGYRSLNEMLNCFEVFLPIVRGNLQLIEQLSFDFCKRQWEQNVVYCEVRYSPHLLAEGFLLDKYENENNKNSSVHTHDAVFAAVTRVSRKL